MRRRLLLTVILLLSAASVFAADKSVKFEVSGPRVVTVGEVFRLEFVLNAKPKEFTPPTIEGLDILAGPALSNSQSISIVNGEVSKTTTYTYTYVLQGNSAGEFSVSEAQAVVDGTVYRTSAFRIEAVDENQDGSDGAQRSADSDAASPSSAAHRQSSGSSAERANGISADDIFVRAIVDKTSVFKGEPVRVTFKLYTRIPMSGVENPRLPSFNGFWSQDLSVDGYQWQRENYNNKVYDSRVFSEYLLYPQQTGTLTIEPMDLTVVAQIVLQSQRRQSLLDDFFGMGPDTQEVRRKLSSQSVKITVKDLPDGAPTGFSGAVGQFSMDASMPSSSISANSAATYTIKISGRGNLPLIQSPKVKFPTSFEQYNVKATESLKPSVTGISGYRQFEYPFIARAEGEYTVPEVEFSFFNPQSAQYETLQSRQFRIDVLPDSSSVGNVATGIVGGLSKEDIKILGQDIRFIRLGQPVFSQKGKFFMCSGWYFALLAALCVIAAVIYIVLRRYLKNMRNDTFVRGKRANRMALQRLRKAETYMKQDNQRGFYDEMLKAMWGYMSDKLNIPVSLLSKENIREQLSKRGISLQHTERFIGIIALCEQAQYSPEALSQMHEVYKEGVELISKLESVIRKK